MGQNRLPIVFLGPSLSRDFAASILCADFRPPIMRGHLDGLPGGTVVGLIDGVFEQSLAVTPSEIHRALSRGVVIFGGASMGALRAAEVPGVKGVGKIFEWYRDGVISRDDEVALIFDPIKHRAITVPMVSVRFSVERLRRSGTIDDDVADALVTSAKQLHFKDRTYRRILEEAGLIKRMDCDDLVKMLEEQDLKKNDAHAVLEAIEAFQKTQPALTTCSDEDTEDRSHEQPAQIGALSEILIWETGDRVADRELLNFLVLTGALRKTEIADQVAEGGAGNSPSTLDGSAVFVEAAKRWGWMSSDEATVTLSDLGLDEDILNEVCVRALMRRGIRESHLKQLVNGDLHSLKAALFLEDMSLKREALRCAALKWFSTAQRGDVPELDETIARRKITQLLEFERYDQVVDYAQRVGFGEQALNSFVDQLTKARSVCKSLLDQMVGAGSAGVDGSVHDHGLGLGPRPKPEGEPRFCSDLVSAEREARAIAARIGVTRIGLIGELGDLGEIQIAQAARPDGAWSSSYGSGKSRRSDGAIIGAVMEEAETWAQENFEPPIAHRASYYDISQSHVAVDPSTLDLPYDTVYRSNLEIDWSFVTDIMTGATVLMPRDPIVTGRGLHDICYTPRGGRKHIATNGLGAGFSIEEAILHGVCEYVERHNQRLAELYLNNPGALGVQPFRFVEVLGISAGIDAVMKSLKPRSDVIRVLDITHEIKIPTYLAAIVRGGRVAHGSATHPNPAVAIESALLEAAQTIASAAAGGREDLSIKARSLGRHERPRPSDPGGIWFWLDPDAVGEPVCNEIGLRSDDVFVDLEWSLRRLSRAGIRQVLVCDLGQQTIDPVRVVRVIIPGLETNNPFYLGPRGRLVLIRDLVPRFA